jgi:DoxX-like protein
MNPKTKKTITWIVTGLASLIIIGGGLAQVAAVKKVAEDMTRVGVGDYYRGLGVLKICLVGLYLYPKTFRLGFLLLCCLFGGAMATLLSHQESVHTAAVPLIVLWIATFLRDRSVFFSA